MTTRSRTGRLAAGARKLAAWGSLAFSAAAACGGNPEYRSPAPGSGATDSSGAGAQARGDGGDGFDLSMAGMSVGEAGAPTLTLEVRADTETIEVSGVPALVAVHARYDDGSVPNRVVWSVDDARIGSVNDQGEFRSNGFVAGDVTVTASVGDQTASVTLHVSVAITADPDGLAEELRSGLAARAAGDPADFGPDAEFRFLYPYDKTVFPRGLLAPVLQFGGAAADATYVKITTQRFSYEAFAAASGLTRVTLPEDAWRGVTLSAEAGEWVDVSVTKATAGEISGPVRERWLVAPGTLKGLVYYNTYRSKLAGNNGAVMRIKPGQSATVLQNGCTVCHGVSAQGNVMVAGVQWDQKNAVVSRAFDLPSNGGIALRNEQDEGRTYAFGGLTPDGSMVLTSGVPPSGAKMRGMSGELATRLVDTASGATIAAPSFGVRIAMTPNFSPEGSRVAFNNHDASTAGHVLSVTSFDGKSEPPAFGEPVDVVTDPAHVVAWPSFVPDGSAVLFHAGDSFDTAKSGGGALYADVRLVDVESKNVNSLAALNGYDQDGRLYLPGGAKQDEHLNYEPSVLPVPVGGYYWVLFTSRRTYGNTIAPGGSLARGDDIWGVPVPPDTETPSPRKKIWIAAIDLDHEGSPDPSHPAFYLPGQELESGNMRAFAALEPCKKKGKACESAAECCDGFCRETGRDATGVPELSCSPPPDNSCSNVDEPCRAPSDCCSSKSLCINRRCATPPPVVK